MFVRILIALVIVYLAIAVIVPFIERVEQTREPKRASTTATDASCFRAKTKT